jgi:Bacterial membrane protein YfhO
MNTPFLKKFLPHIVAIVVSFFVIFAYFNPLMSGKVLKQHDVQQWRATYHEIETFEKSSGERTFWTNSIFSGMPTYLIGASYKNNFTNNISFYISKVMPNPIDTLFLLFICFYILLLTFEVSPWLAIAGSLAFMFSTFNFINIDAGHIGKGNAIAFIPLVLAGINITLRKNKLLGALLTGIAVSFELAAGHVQITYYLAILIMVWMIAEAIIAIKEKRIVPLLVCGLYLGIAALLGAGTNITGLITTEEYGKYSIRGKSELTKNTKGESNEENSSTGLDKDYALQWSNGVSEPFTLLIPNFYGGSSMGELSTNSETYKLLKQNNVPNPKQVVQQMPIYWGTQPFTAGPIYYGAIICFLFAFGFLILKDKAKWWILAISLLAIFLSMGKNFMPLTDIFFYYFPLYNKFRSVTFMLALAQVTFPLLAMLAIRDLMKGEIKKEELTKKLLYSFYFVGGICFLFAAVPGMFFDFTSQSDSQLPEWLRPALIADRESLLRMDAFRSLALIAVTVGLIWLFIAKKIKQEYFVGVLLALIVFDLWQVDKRYLNDKDFEVKKKTEAESFTKTEADEMILQDKDPNYRVYNTTQRLDQDALTSYWHKSIGGYHGAKMRRYQELIEFQIGKGNNEIYNMLNVKYFIVEDSSRRQIVERNPLVNGNAWFVKDYIVVNNADAEMDSLTHFNSKGRAVIDTRFSDQIKDYKITPDTTAKISETTYAPNKLGYTSEAATPQMAVFSEVYYDKGWNAYVDGKLTPHFRCDYVLRGMIVPAGKHTIEFKFEPTIVKTGETIALYSSVLLYGGILSIGGLVYFRRRKESEDQSE